MSASFPERRASCLGCFRQRIGSWSTTSEHSPCELGPAFSLSECPQVAPARASLFSSQMAKTQIPRPTKVGNPMICKGKSPTQNQNPYILHLGSTCSHGACYRHFAALLQSLAAPSLPVLDLNLSRHNFQRFLTQDYASLCLLYRKSTGKHVYNSSSAGWMYWGFRIGL